jgi:hypothetical protein
VVEGEEDGEGGEQKDPQIPLPHPRNRKSGDETLASSSAPPS